MNILTKENSQKTPKHENEDQVFSDDNNNMVKEEQEEVEEKKQKRSGKRGGSGSGSGSGVCCQAEECRVDLTEAKRYHRRHKVCEFHAKAHSVLVSGLTQRFCQQCSRFHELTEFDEAKRSCRRRLAGHNERRRKTSSEQQREAGSSSSRTKATATATATSPQCRPADHVSNNVQMTTAYPRPATTPTNYQHYEIR